MSESCCICFQPLLDKDKVIIECGHSFHFSCILRIENRNCPLCRKRYAENVPLSFHQLFATAVLLMDKTEKSHSIHRKLVATHRLLDTLLTILETYGAPAILCKLRTKIPELKREFSGLGYSESQFECYEERLRKLLNS